MKKLSLLIICLLIFTGCQDLRFGATQVQKQNAWVHQKTAQMVAEVALDEGASEELHGLTQLSELQSRAFVADYGLPQEYPQAETIDDLLAAQPLAIQAANDSSLKPDTWDMFDSTIEVGIGIAGLLGGVWGVRLAGFLSDAQKKSLALKEIILGNELFKKQNTEIAAEFKKSHTNQSSTTKQIVAEIKNV
jgi:hypothetical protein